MKPGDYADHLRRQRNVLRAAERRKGEKATKKPTRLDLQMAFREVMLPVAFTEPRLLSYLILATAHS